MCRDRGAAVQLSARHLEACGGTLLNTDTREIISVSAGPAGSPSATDSGHPPCEHLDLICAWPIRIWALRCVRGTVPLDDGMSFFGC